MYIMTKETECSLITPYYDSIGRFVEITNQNPLISQWQIGKDFDPQYPHFGRTILPSSKKAYFLHFKATTEWHKQHA